MKLFGLEIPQAPVGQLQLPRGQQLLIATAVIFLGGLLIAHRMIIQPLDRQAAALQEQLNTQQQQAELLRALQRTTQQLGQLQQRLVGRKGTATLLQELTTMAATAHLTMNTLAPQPAETFGRYPRLPIVLEATGAFADIVHFVDALQTATIPFSMDRLELGSTRMETESGGTAGGYGSWPNTQKTSADAFTAPVPLRVRMTVSTLLSEAS